MTVFRTRRQYTSLLLMLAAAQLGSVHVSVAQCPSEEIDQATGDSPGQDRFGVAVDVTAGRAIVGAPNETSLRGTAYIYLVDATGFDREDRLTAGAFASNNDKFGTDVAIDATLAIVGAPGDDGVGTAFVFRLDGGNWVQEQRLTTDGNGAAGAGFGTSVALDGNLAVVGAPADTGGGAVYVFRRQGMVWTREERITHDGGVMFGRSVAASGDAIAIGGKKQAFVYRLDQGSWGEEGDLTPPGLDDNSEFGIGIAIDVHVVVVGDEKNSTESTFAGAAFVFRFDQGVWGEEQLLTAADAAILDFFGSSVGVSGDQIIVGARGDDDGPSSAGSAYPFVFDGADWIESPKLNAASPEASEEFGGGVAIEGAVIVVGAPRTDAGGASPGSAYLFGSAFCFIDSMCHIDGRENPQDSCEECNFDLNPTDWSLRPDGTECGVGTECEAETCQSGSCMFGPRIAGTSCGDASSSDCDEADSCDGQGGCVANHLADDILCSSDGNECTDNVCSGGLCGHPPVATGAPCGDSNPSHPLCDNADVCDGQGTCDPNWVANGSDCNDGVFCNGLDSCMDGFCLSAGDPCMPEHPVCDEKIDDCIDSCLGPDDCDDGISCTSNICDSGDCMNPLMEGSCRIGGVCYVDGERNPADECEECNTALDTADWSLAPAGTSCGSNESTDCDNPDTCDGAGTCLVNFESDGFSCSDDSNDCTDNQCSSGVCMHPDLPIGTPCGDLPQTECDAADTCDGNGSCIDQFVAVGTPCGDSSETECDGADSCDGNGNCADNFVAADIACGDPADSDCDKPDACDGVGTCSPKQISDGVLCTDDGNICTFDLCISAVCMHPPTDAGGQCGDQSDTACDAPDICDGFGACDPNPKEDGTPCDDDLFCNGGGDTDACSSGQCTGSSDPCAANQVCDESADACVECLADTDCPDDGNPCNTAACNVATNMCEDTNNDDGTSCDDGSFCTTGDACQSGQCVGGANPCSTGQICDDTRDACVQCLTIADCADDGNPCTSVACDAATGVCQTTNNDAGDCDDGLFCNGAESCVAGSCEPGAALCPEDETCVEAVGGTCLECVDGADCDDGDPCTADRCPDGRCDNTIILPACRDDDGDGVLNADDACEGFDDRDDADSDGVPDGCDSCPDDDSNDADRDGICGDVDNCPEVRNSGQADADGDGLGDACDDCPDDPENDADSDGVCGDVDNCPAVSNEDQDDADGDGDGDACDDCPNDATNDADRDGACADVDNCPLIPNPNQADSDEDGFGDVCDACPNDPDPDADEDGDGFCGQADQCPETPAGETVDENGCAESQLEDPDAPAEVPDGIVVGGDDGQAESTPLCGIFGMIPLMFTMLSLAAARSLRSRRRDL